MPETSDEMNAFIAETNALMEQRAENLKEYGKKYREIDAQVKALSNERYDLFQEVERLKGEQEALGAELDKVRNKADEILKDARTAAAESLKKAEQEIAERMEVVSAQSLKIMDADVISRELRDKANKDVREADQLLNEARIEKRNAEIILADAQKKMREASIIDDDAREGHAEVVRRMDALLIREEVLAAQKVALDEEKTKVGAELRRLVDLSADLQKKIADAEALIVQRDIALKEFNDSTGPLLEGLKKQSEDNAWRSRELDLGFEKLKNDQASLKKDQAKIDLMKKELMKKETI